ncbi:MAG TPA: SLATT domain-containing protein [Methanomassiliicoccales archaeon]|jgi:hypothetical protein
MEDMGSDLEKSDEMQLVHSWLKGVKIQQIGHLRAAAYYEHMGFVLGFIVTILTVIIGSSAFVSLSSAKNDALLIVTGIISIVAAILAALQTFLKFPEIAGKHQTAGLRYGKLRHHIDEIIVCVASSEELKKELKSIRNEWDQIDEEMPPLSQHFVDVAMKIVSPLTAKRRERILKGTESEPQE